MRTYSTKAKDVEHQWHVVDASGKTLGRLVSRIAVLLMGKHKPYYVPYLDTGDYVVVINASKVKVTGNKTKQKTYYRHSNYPGGLKAITFNQQLAKDSRKIIELAVKNMLPKNKLRQQRLKRLKIFKTDKHPYQDKLTKSSKK